MARSLLAHKDSRGKHEKTMHPILFYENFTTSELGKLNWDKELRSDTIIKTVLYDTLIPISKQYLHKYLHTCLYNQET